MPRSYEARCEDDVAHLDVQVERVAPLPTALGGTPSSAAASSGSTKKKNKPNWARIRVVRPLSIAQHDVAMLTGILSQIALRVLPRKGNGDFYIPSDFNKAESSGPGGRIEAPLPLRHLHRTGDVGTCRCQQADNDYTTGHGRKHESLARQVSIC